MSKAAISEEGISALKRLAQNLNENIEVIEKATNELQNIYEENAPYLAPHADSLGQVIEDVRQVSSEAAEPVDGLSEKVIALADEYREFIDDDPYAGIAGN